MTARSRLTIAALWILSLVLVAQLSTRAQAPTPAGVEVRFVGSGQSGILVGNFGGQWLPITLTKMPDANNASR
jgi:hypothetical protein